MNEIYASFQELSLGNQQCDNADNNNAAADKGMIPMCQPCFAGDTTKEFDQEMLQIQWHSEEETLKHRQTKIKARTQLK